jgi:ABC-type phosphate/phosphonate transport system substrate-binding protein
MQVLCSARLKILCLIGLSLLMNHDSRSQEGKGAFVSCNIGFSSKHFSDLNTTDALAATRVWADMIRMKKGYSGTSGAKAYDDLDELANSTKRKELDLAILLPFEYLKIQETAPLTPIFIASTNDRVDDETLLLVHRRNAASKLEDLKGKEIIISGNAATSLGRIWLETQIMESGFSSLDSFFGKSSNAAKASQAVLPVFFGKSDACLINRQGFSTMVEMNPQLARDLKVIAQSPGYPICVICIRKDYDPLYRDVLMDGLSQLHLEPRGQQILTLFKVTKLIPFDKAYMQTSQQTVRNFLRLQNRPHVSAGGK